MCWSIYVNRLFNSEKKGVWTNTMVHYTCYSFRDIEGIVKKVASVVVKASASKTQVSFGICFICG